VKWLFFFLVLCNASFYLWATGHPRSERELLQPGEADVNIRSMMLLSERTELGGNNDQTCIRIGPFLTQSTFAEASRVLQEMGLSYSKTAVSARKLKTFRALVLAPTDDASLTTLRKKLDEIGVDHYKFEDSGTNYLSVGLFSQPLDARNFVGRLKEDDIEVNYRPELRTLGPLRWIEVDSLPDKYAQQQLNTVQWGDAMANVVQFPCAG
jgi:hypothetical protein